MSKSWHFVTIFWALLPFFSHAFLAPCNHGSLHRQHYQLKGDASFLRKGLSSSVRDDNEEKGFNASSKELFIPPNAQDIRQFLTQRCLQSFMFLLASTRDLHTISWLDNFTKPVIIDNYWDEESSPNPGVDSFRENDKRLGSKLLNYHGLFALNTTIFPEWDSFFKNLIEEPNTVLLISTPSDIGKRAYSEIDIDIEPARLCSRMLSVREQIARELVGDLEAISKMGQMIFDSYYYNARNRKDSKKGSGGREGEDSSPHGFDRPSQMYMNFDPHDDYAYAPSPLRKGNFDLLYLLSTQEAVLQLLHKGVIVGEDDVQNRACTEFLEMYYRERLITHFVGAQFYGKADDFVEEMMLKSPIMSPKGSGGAENDDELPLVVEPLRVAEQILLLRDKLALEWKVIMEGTASEHTDIRRLQLARLTMGQQAPETTDEFQ